MSKHDKYQGLRVSNLTIGPKSSDAPPIVKGISFNVAPGKTLGLVGETGSGKSLSTLSILGLLPKNLKRRSGDITLGEHDLGNMRRKALRRVRGDIVSLIFQSPASALNPTTRVGPQIAEAYRIHTGASAEEARQRVYEYMSRVEIRNPEQRYRMFPHELSGGLQQRVMIAMALICEPVMLLADEPTTALDVTVQAQVIRLIKEKQVELGMSMLIVTHNLGVAAEMCDEVAIMKDGQIVEHGQAVDIFDNPQDEYTRRLLAATPRIGG